MTQPSAADTLRAAAFQLRNPFHRAGLKVAVDTDVATPLADLLEATAQYADLHADLCRAHGVEPDDGIDWSIRHALAVARVILGEQP